MSDYTLARILLLVSFAIALAVEQLTPYGIPALVGQAGFVTGLCLWLARRP